MNKHPPPPPPINVLATALLVCREVVQGDKFQDSHSKILITADNNIHHTRTVFSLRKGEEEPKSVNLDKISTALHVYRLNFIAKSPNTVKSAQKQLRIEAGIMNRVSTTLICII